MSFPRPAAIKLRRAILLLAAAASGAAATAQAVPDGTSLAGFALPPVSGTLRYDLNYSQTSEFGYGQDGRQMSTASGDASYANSAKRLPFRLQYGGGYGWTWAGPSSPGNVFQHLSLSQGVSGRAWNLAASDNVNYSFQTQAASFSGSTSAAGQTVLSVNTRTLDNTAALDAGYRLNAAWSVNAGGSYEQMRFIDDNGQDMNTVMADGGLSRRLNARNTVSGQYSFSRYSYSGAGLTSRDKVLQFSFTRQWNRRITTTAGAGPQWFSSAGAASSASNTRFSSVMLSLNASASYAMRNGAASVGYTYGSNGGSGYMLGSKVNSVSGNFSRALGKNLTVGVTGGYTRTTSLIAAEFEYACTIGNVVYQCLVPLREKPSTSARYGGVQATRKLGRYFNAFANYTASDQSSTMQVAVPKTALSYSTNILNGLDQSISFGIGYSPREIRLRK